MRYRERDGAAVPGDLLAWGGRRPPNHRLPRVRPESKPQMSGLKPEYTTDEVIDVVCTSKRSYPAAKIVFFVNDEPVRF